MKGKRTLPVVIAVVLLCAAALLLFPKQHVGFDGDRIRNTDPDRFYLRFNMMDTADHEVMSLKEGNKLHIAWHIESGSVDILISMEGEDAVYRADDRKNGDRAEFDLTVPRSGDYRISVNARKAKGQIEFVNVPKE